jgi:sugar phosphate isomerase/epimerase
LKRNTIGVNLFSVRPHCKTFDELDATLRRIAAIGYEWVQVSGIGPTVTTEQTKELLDKHHLGVCATHERLEAIVGDTDSVVARLDHFGTSFCALGHPGDTYFRAGGAKELATIMREPARQLAARGLSLGYHNHDREFERFDSETFFESYLAETQKDPISLELDVHWVARGGASPAHVIEKWGHRIGAIHLKDYAMDHGTPAFAEIGEGNLDWDGIMAACDRNEIRLLIVEQDEPRLERDIFSSLEISFQNMRRMGIAA